MKVVVAPDKFKGSLTSAQAAQAIVRGMRSVWPDADFVVQPMADGGEGTVEVFLQVGAQRHVERVRGPLGDPVDAAFAMQDKTAILEMSAASGLGLLDAGQYDPLHADTFGTGELIAAALAAGADRAIIGIGGSATNDCGTGMLRALGVRFRDANGDELGRAILEYAHLSSIDVSGLDARLAAIDVLVATDVDNPLCGSSGAARTFAAQKGATDEQIAQLDLILAHIADVAALTLGRDERNTPGAGAAGGLGYAFLQFVGARMESGVQIIARERNLAGSIRGAALCVTGEGKIDDQTLHGKTVDGLAKLARRMGVAAVAFGGSVDPRTKSALEDRGVAVRAIAPSETPAAESMKNAAALLEGAARGYAGEFERSRS